MNLSGSYTFEASPERVFDLLTDATVVANCLPGCEKLEPIGDNRYRAILSIGVAAITGRYEGTVELRDLNRPSSYVLVFSGQGKPGFINGEGRVEIEAAETGSVVKVEGQAQAGGAIARIGQRLLGGTSKMITDRFFACLQRKAAE